MAEETQAAADPSMEEILASIRKIISDEAPAVEMAPEPEAEPVVEEAPEILELTQMVEEDGTVTDLSPPPEPEAQPLPSAPPPPSAPLLASPPLASTEALISEPAATIAASKLSSLANTLEIERLSSAPAAASYLGNGHRTLEDMVIELMRPLLKDWLDQNLPGTVERLVQKEIERIARRS